ncbi:hypothetical protein ACWDA7_39950 [Streptomyces sp. NPDC001156]
MAVGGSSARLTKQVAVSVAVAVVLAALGWWVYYRATYHTFAFWEAPPRLTYYGRNWDTFPGATVSSLPRGTTHALVDTIEPAGWKLYAVGLSSRHDRQLGVPCAESMFLEKGSHEYVTYDLSGGP